MSKRRDNIILIFLLVLFFFLFRSNALMRESIINSCCLWFTSLVPSIISIFIVIDLALNYGLINIFYKIFKSNKPILILLCLLLGTPTSTKYIKEFYENGYISKDEAECILAAFYSPNPLFIINICPSINTSICILLFIYITDIIVYIFLKKKNKVNTSSINYQHLSFSKCLKESMERGFNVLVLVLGTIIFFGLINTVLELFISKNNIIIYCLTELVNATKIINETHNYEWLLFSISFAGLSIHAQIKSILDDTDIRYKYFLFVRLLISLVAILITIFY